MYDTLFSAGTITEFIRRDVQLLIVRGYIGYSADTSDVEFIYDKIANIIYVYGSYRTMTYGMENELYKDSFEISYDKYWKFENYNLNEYNTDKQYETIDNTMPYYRFPRTKDGISIPRVIFNVFKIFNDDTANKPKIIIPNIFNTYAKIKKID